MSTPLLDADLDRFGRDLLEAAPVHTPTRARRLTVAVAVALLLLVPGAIAGVDALFLGADHPRLKPPPGFTIPKVTGPVVDVTAGEVAGGAWRAYAVRCGARASVIVVSPTGSRTSGACGAVPPGGPRPAPAFAPSLFYDGEIQTTFIDAAVPATVARVRLELAGRAGMPGAGPSVRELAPVSAGDTLKSLGVDVKFVVVAIPGEQHIRVATAFDAAGNVLSRCDDNGNCE